MLSYISFLSFVILIIALYNKKAESMLLVIYLIFTYLWVIASNVYIENSHVYLIQTGYTGKTSGSTFRLVVLLSIMLIAYFYVTKNVCTNTNSNSLIPIKRAKYWIMFSIGLSLYYALSVFLNLSLPFTYQINQCFPCCSFVLGNVLYCTRENKKFFGKAIFGCVVFFLVVIIARYFDNITFTQDLLFFLALVTPFLLRLKHLKIKIFKVKNIILAVIPLLLMIIFKFQKFDGTEYSGVNGVNTIIDIFLYRALALEGEVWFDIDLNVISKDPFLINFSKLSNEFSAFLFNNQTKNAGIYSIMQQIKLSYNPDSLSTLNAGFPAIVIDIFGYTLITFVVMFLCGILLGKMTNLIFAAMNKNEYITLFFLYGILVSFFTGFTMGGLFYFSSLFIIFNICGFLISRIKIKNNKISIKKLR